MQMKPLNFIFFYYALKRATFFFFLLTVKLTGNKLDQTQLRNLCII